MTIEDVKNWPLSEIVKLPNFNSLRRLGSIWIVGFRTNPKPDGGFELFGKDVPSSHEFTTKPID